MNEVTIIGTGPAGLTAAIYTARAGLNPVVYAGMQHGGQLTTTTEIENFPGFENGISGPQLMADMTKQAERVGTKIVYEEIDKVDFSASTKKMWAGNTEISSKTVIICTGATARTLNLENESKLMGRGLSTCATCDGFFYRGKVVAVVGGGDSAMEEAMYLAKLCAKVYLVHRRDHFRASPIMVERAKKTENMEFLVPWAPTETLFNDTGLTGVKLKHSENGEEKEIILDGLFYAIGHTPNSAVFKGFVETDQNGYIQVTNHTHTKTPGIFAAGDIADSEFRQAITAAGMGCQAGMQAQRYIEELEG